ncbi:hypothetical protein Q3G72_034978 [Acer saccharum]|nr:hypothetical protein Q3G72_034978 [Acer saccharum]
MGALQFFRRSNGLLGTKTYPVGCIQSRAFSDSKIIIDSNDTVLPVLIVGAGPVGLVLSILLTKLEEIERSPVATACRIMEKVHILYITQGFNSWFTLRQRVGASRALTSQSPSRKSAPLRYPTTVGEIKTS